MQNKNGNLLQTHFMAFQDYITLCFIGLFWSTCLIGSAFYVFFCSKLEYNGILVCIFIKTDELFMLLNLLIQNRRKINVNDPKHLENVHFNKQASW